MTQAGNFLKPMHVRSQAVPVTTALAVVIVVFLVLLTPVQLRAGTPVVLHRFTGYTGDPMTMDGANPAAVLTVDPGGGYVYGTTLNGGLGYGAVFAYQLSLLQYGLLYTFTGQSDGAAPGTGVVFGGWDLYGTTSAAQLDNCSGATGCGTVFRLTKLVPPCNPFCTYNLDTLYTFLGGTNDGSAPHGEVVLDSSGNVYGTTRYGGMGTSGLGSICGDKRSADKYGCGTVFQLIPGPPKVFPWHENILWQFSYGMPSCGVDGLEPYGALTFDNSGSLFGTTLSGGKGSTNNGQYGMAFRLAKSGASWLEYIIQSFDDGYSGGFPFGGLFYSNSFGALFGSDANAGGNGTGTAYQLTPSASCSSWTYKKLQDMPTGLPTLNLSGLRGNLITGVTQNNYDLYGVETTGGSGYGAIIKIPYAGGGMWGSPEPIFSFPSDGSYGLYPMGGLATDGQGNLFGITYSGGTSCIINQTGDRNYRGCGVLFQITP
ncbi:MAG: choice-of-anchor tandem repeat GloVer-containing protein [Candidatus Korobacteraceae bacterium]